MERIKISQLHNNPENYLGRDLVIEGVLVAPSLDKQWFIVPNKGDYVNPENGILISSPLSRQDKLRRFPQVGNPITSDISNPLFWYSFLDDVEILATLHDTNKEQFRFQLEVEEITVFRTGYVCYFKRTPFAAKDVELEINTLFRVSDIIEHPDRFINNRVRVGGIIYSAKPSNQLYIADYSVTQDEIETAFTKSMSLKIDEPSIDEKLTAYVGRGMLGNIIYKYSSNIVADIIPASGQDFPLELVNIQDVVIERPHYIIHIKAHA